MYYIYIYSIFVFNILIKCFIIKFKNAKYLYFFTVAKAIYFHSVSPLYVVPPLLTLGSTD